MFDKKRNTELKKYCSISYYHKLSLMEYSTILLIYSIIYINYFGNGTCRFGVNDQNNSKREREVPSPYTTSCFVFFCFIILFLLFVLEYNEYPIGFQLIYNV